MRPHRSIGIIKFSKTGFASAGLHGLRLQLGIPFSLTQLIGGALLEESQDDESALALARGAF